MSDERLRAAIEDRARVSGVGVSEVIRSALYEALEERPLGSGSGI